MDEAILCLACGLLSVAAVGQAAAAESEATPMTAIIVTARKIEEDVRDVPMSVQALSTDFLAAANLTRLYELQFSVPGLVVNNVGLFGAQFALRGVADQSGNGQSVALHLDGVYLASANMVVTRSFDLERIEVLKGPQGTLYGATSTGGSINYITRAPEREFSAGIEAAYASFATKRAEGYVNLPTQNAAVRLAFIASEGDGYIRNSVDDRRFAEDDFWGVRASLAADLTDRLHVSVMAQHVEDDGATGDLWTPNPERLADPSDIRLATVTLADPHLYTEDDNVNLTLEYELGFGTVRSIAGYARTSTENLDDCFGVEILEGCVRGGELRFDQWSEELQLRLHGNSHVSGMLAISYLESEDEEDFDEYRPKINPRPTNLKSVLRKQAAAVFGQGTLRFSDRWSAGGGLRLSRDQSRLNALSTGHLPTPTHVTGEYDADEVSWRMDLTCAVSDELMLYAEVSTGYQSGGVIPDPGSGGLDRFEPEDLLAYEVGAKARLLDKRLSLNASAFYYDVEDLQVRVFAPTGSRISNAAGAVLYGIDADGAVVISDRATVSGGVVWMPKREYVEFVDNGSSFSGNELIRAPEWSASAALDYQLPLRDLGTFSARLEYSYRSRYFFTSDNLPNFMQEGFGLVNLLLRLESNRGWYVFASGRNLADEDYFHQVLFQSSPGYPDTYEIGAGYRF